MKKYSKHFFFFLLFIGYYFIIEHCINFAQDPGPEVVKPFSCSTQLSMNFFMLIILKLLTTANSVLLNIAEYGHFSANKYENAKYCSHSHTY